MLVPFFSATIRPAFFENVEMAGERGPRQRKPLGDLAGGHGALAQQPQDFAAGGIAQGLKDGIHALFRVFR